METINVKKPSRDKVYIAYLCAMMVYMGMTEASIGPNLPAMQQEYHLTTAAIASLTVPHALGFMTGALLVSSICQCTDVRTTMMLATLLWLFGTLLIAYTPPFILIHLATFSITLAGGFTEVMMSTLGQAVGPHILSLLWGVSHIGAMSAPALTALFVRNDWPWQYYYGMLAMVPVSLALYQWFTLGGRVQTDSAAIEPMNIAEKVKLLYSIKAVRVALASSVLAFAFMFLALEWLPLWFLHVQNTSSAFSRLLPGAISLGIATSRILYCFSEEPFIGILPSFVRSALDRIWPAWHAQMTNKTQVPALHSLIMSVALIILWLVRYRFMQAMSLYIVGYLWGYIVPLTITLATADAEDQLKPTIIGAIIASGFVGAATMPYLFGLFCSMQALPFVMILVALVQGVIFLWMPEQLHVDEYVEVLQEEGQPGLPVQADAGARA